MSNERLEGYELGPAIDTLGRVSSYEARRKSDARAVLVKMPSSAMQDNAAAESQLREERKSLLNIEHSGLPNVVTYIEEGPALVLESHGGFRLDRIVDNEPVSAEQAIAIALRIASILSAIHRSGRAHGLLRLGSIELTDTGGVYLHDLGVPSPSDDLRSPSEMAPEQVREGHADERTDVYLLGLLLQSMLHQVPSKGRGLASPVKRPPRFVLPWSKAQLPARLEAITGRCLHRRPSERFDSIDALSFKLSSVLRRSQTAPIDQLVRAAVANAGLGREAGQTLGRPKTALLGTGGRPTRAILALTIGAGILLAGSLYRWSGSASIASLAREPRGIVKSSARLRFLAQPWAQVFVDGKRVGVTPMAETYEVSPGRHIVEFRHPKATTQKRTIEVISGQQLTIDIAMPVEGAKPKPSSRDDDENTGGSVSDEDDGP